MDISILVYDGFDELDAVGPYEVFQNASEAGAACSATLEPTAVTASHGLRVEPDGRLADADPEMVLVPGGGWNDRESPGAWTEAERGAIPEAVAGLAAAGVTMAGVCTGVMLLARAGITDGRPAITHQGAVADLEATDAEVLDARVVDDGDLLTAGGVTSGLDLAFHVLRREFGADVADAVATEMEYEPRGSVHRG
jgi:transcriptional regulator GlxA family with amidase domain